MFPAHDVVKPTVPPRSQGAGSVGLDGVPVGVLADDVPAALVPQRRVPLRSASTLALIDTQSARNTFSVFSSEQLAGLFLIQTLACKAVVKRYIERVCKCKRPSRLTQINHP